MSIKFDHTGEYYRTSEKENALDNLDKLDQFCIKAKNDKSYWKWIILALHGTLYNFMLLALLKSDGSGIWENEIRDEQGYIDTFNKKIKVINFLTAYEWIQNKQKMECYVNSESFQSNKEIDEAMDRLNTEFRNQFIHYKPIGWSIEIEILKKLIDKTVPVIEFLIFKSSNIFFNETCNKEIGDILKRMKNQK